LDFRRKGKGINLAKKNIPDWSVDREVRAKTEGAKRNLTASWQDKNRLVMESMEKGGKGKRGIGMDNRVKNSVSTCPLFIKKGRDKCLP